MIRTLIASALIASLFSCASSEKSSSSSDRSGGGSKSSRPIDDDFYVSKSFKTLTVSMSNNRDTSRTYSSSAAKGLSRKIGRSDDRTELVAKMTAARLAGEKLDTVISYAKKLVMIELKKDRKRTVPEFAKMELVLAAVANRKYSYAEYFIDDLVNSSSKRIRAAAHTAQGMIHLRDSRLPEAVEEWRKALKNVPTYPAALLNSGFIALKYGDFERAKSRLSGMQGDWFAAYGLIIAERMTKGYDRAATLCRRVMNSNSRHKPTYLACALNSWQGLKRADEAKKYIAKMNGIAGNAKLDDAGRKLRSTIDRDLQKQSQAKKAAPKKKDN